MSGERKMPDIAPGKTWEDCTVEQRINRLVGALFELSTQVQFLQDTLMTHEHSIVQATPPLVDIKKKSVENGVGIAKKEGGSE